MRVAVIGSPWVPVPPHAYGGTEAVLDGLLRGLVRAGHEVIYFGHPDSTVGTEVRCSLRREDIGPIGDAASELAHVIAAHEQAEAWGADVVHDHTLVGALVGRSVHDLPIVVTNHGPFNERTLPIFRQIEQVADIVAISHAQAATAQATRVAGVVHHGLDLDAFPLGAGGGPLVFLGRMHPDKGPHRAVRIARRTGIPLVLAAKMREPAERAYFERHVRPLLGTDARYVGEVDMAGKRELLREASALLNPISWPEPFGMVMLEALACGTPVVTAPLGAAPEIVADGVTGKLCRSEAHYVSGVQSALTLDRAACRASVARRFTVERMVEGYVEQFRHSLLGALSPLVLGQ